MCDDLIQRVDPALEQILLLNQRDLQGSEISRSSDNERQNSYEKGAALNPPDLIEERYQAMQLMRRLHSKYKEQLNSCIVAMSKFDKCTKYFVRAIKKVKPSSAECFSSIKMVEEGLQSCRDDPELTNTHVMLQTFLTNVRNYRLFRTEVKMNILALMKKMPLETEAQKKVRGEVEVILNSWSVLTSVENDLSKLEHQDTLEENDSLLFENPREKECYAGIFSLLPKLTDLCDRLDLLLLKYLL